MVLVRMMAILGIAFCTTSIRAMEAPANKIDDPKRFSNVSTFESCSRDLIVCLTPGDLRSLVFLLDDDLWKGVQNSSLSKHILFFKYVIESASNKPHDYMETAISQRLGHIMNNPEQQGLIEKVEVLLTDMRVQEDIVVSRVLINTAILDMLASFTGDQLAHIPSLFDFSKVTAHEAYIVVSGALMNSMPSACKNLIKNALEKLYKTINPGESESSIKALIEERCQQLNRVIGKVNRQQLKRKTHDVEETKETAADKSIEQALRMLIEQLNDTELERLFRIFGCGIFHPAIAQGLLVKLSMVQCYDKPCFAKKMRRHLDLLYALIFVRSGNHDEVADAYEKNMSAYLRGMMCEISKGDLKLSDSLRKDRLLVLAKAYLERASTPPYNEQQVEPAAKVIKFRRAEHFDLRAQADSLMAFQGDALKGAIADSLTKASLKQRTEFLLLILNDLKVQEAESKKIDGSVSLLKREIGLATTKAKECEEQKLKRESAFAKIRGLLNCEAKRSEEQALGERAQLELAIARTQQENAALQSKHNDEKAALVEKVAFLTDQLIPAKEELEKAQQALIINAQDLKKYTEEQEAATALLKSQLASVNEKLSQSSAKYERLYAAQETLQNTVTNLTQKCAFLENAQSAQEEQLKEKQTRCDRLQQELDFAKGKLSVIAALFEKKS